MSFNYEGKLQEKLKNLSVGQIVINRLFECRMEICREFKSK